MPTRETISGRVRSFASLSKPHMQVVLNSDTQHANSYIHSFTTGDMIQGVVSIVVPSDTQFEDIEISFVGQAKTHVDRISPSAAISARSEAYHTFLKMDFPIDVTRLPEDRILKAEHTYELPFNFIVPRSTLNACRHTTSTPELKEMHNLLPPSLGVPEMAGRGSSLIDDCAPDMSRLWFSIRSRMHKVRESDGKRIKIADAIRKIRVVPGYAEQPPVSVADTDEDYLLRTEKSIRKNLLKPKIGRVAVVANQPKSLHLPRPEQDPKDVTTTASVQLRFDPLAEDIKPPKLGQLTAKLRVGTFYTASPRAGIPTGKAAANDTTQGLYVDVCQLSSRNMRGAEWTKHDPHTPSSAANLRRDSGMSIIGGPAECPDPTKIYKPELPFYTAQLLLPISPPRNRVLVPSFQSCLVSRVYILEVILGVGFGSSAALKLPLQITSEGGPEISPFETGAYFATEIEDELGELEEADSIDQYFSPRRISSPAAGPSQTGVRPVPRRRSDQLPPPPEYNPFAPRTGGVLHRSCNDTLYQRLSMVR